MKYWGRENREVQVIFYFFFFLKIKLPDHRLGNNHGSIYVDLSNTLGKTIHGIFKDKVEKWPENYSVCVCILHWLRQRQEKHVSPSSTSSLNGKPCLAGHGSGGDRAGNLDN